MGDHLEIFKVIFEASQGNWCVLAHEAVAKEILFVAREEESWRVLLYLVKKWECGVWESLGRFLASYDSTSLLEIEGEKRKAFDELKQIFTKASEN